MAQGFPRVLELEGSAGGSVSAALKAEASRSRAGLAGPVVESS
jgi:hypothetical protein